jgi:hypothetical protein
MVFAHEHAVEVNLRLGRSSPPPKEMPAVKHRTAATAIVGTFVALSGCGSGVIHASDAASLGVMTVPARSASLQETSLDAALSQLRPEWLRVSPSSRQIAEPARASVYIDNVYTGDLGILRLVPVSDVIEVSFLGPSAARDRFGLGCQCAAGAIVVVTRTIK